MTLKEMIYDVLTTVREMSDDSNITESYIEQQIKAVRAKYIQQEYSKRNVVNQISVQSFNLGLTPVDSSNNLVLSTGYSILESEVLPELVQLAKRPGIIRVSTLDSMRGEVNIVNMARLKYTVYSKFKTINAALDSDNKLIVVGNKASSILLETLTVDAVLEDPTDIRNYSFKGRVVGTELGEYPVPIGMWQDMKKEIINEVFVSYKVPVDNTNNEADDKEIQPSA